MNMNEYLVIDLGVDDYMITEKLLKHIEDVIASADGAKAIIISGSKDVFCKGLNISDVVNGGLSKVQIKNNLLNFKAVMERIKQCPLPIIAKVDGNIYGGGVGIMCVADIVIMSKTSEISLPETIMGVIPAMIFPYIIHRISVSKAKELALGTRPISAVEALTLGMIDEVADDTNLALNKCLKRVCRIDLNACASLKALINKHYYINNEMYINDAIESFIQLISSETTKERITKFVNGECPWE